MLKQLIIEVAENGYVVTAHDEPSADVACNVFPDLTMTVAHVTKQLETWRDNR
jgi:hypothetical protein